MKALISHIELYREQNDLARIENIYTVVTNYICSLPENLGACRPLTLERGFMGYLKGGIALLTNLYYGEKNMVDKEEAERRASLCVNCPLNVFLDKGAFIKWSDEIALHSTNGKRVSVHEKLGNCAACSCPLRAKVWYRGYFELSKEEKDNILQHKADCWQLK